MFKSLSVCLSMKMTPHKSALVSFPKQDKPRKMKKKKRTFNITEIFNLISIPFRRSYEYSIHEKSNEPICDWFSVAKQLKLQHSISDCIPVTPQCSVALLITLLLSRLYMQGYMQFG